MGRQSFIMTELEPGIPLKKRPSKVENSLYMQKKNDTAYKVRFTDMMVLEI